MLYFIIRNIRNYFWLIFFKKDKKIFLFEKWNTILIEIFISFTEKKRL